MNTLVKTVYQILGKGDGLRFRLPYGVAYGIGKVFDLASFITNKKFTISSIRVKKFCSSSHFGSSVSKTGFVPPVSLPEALQRTIHYELIARVRRQRCFIRSEGANKRKMV